MGEVYSPEAINIGDYPHLPDLQYSPGIHERAARQILDGLIEYCPPSAAGEIVGAIAYGRTALGGTERSSDLDLLVRIHEPGQKIRNQLKELFGQVRAEHHVPIEPNWLDSGQAQARCGAVAGDPLFVDHLRFVAKTAPEMVIGKPIADLIGLPDYPAEEQAFEAMKSSLRFFASMKDWGEYFQGLNSDSFAFDTTAMRHAFGLPTALGRKMLTCITLQDTGVNPAYEPSFYDHARFAQTAHRIRLHLKEPHEAIDFLIERSDRYKRILEEVIHEQCTIESYTMWLETMYPPVMEHASTLAQAVGQMAYSTGLVSN